MYKKKDDCKGLFRGKVETRELIKYFRTGDQTYYDIHFVSNMWTYSIYMRKGKQNS